MKKAVEISKRLAKVYKTSQYILYRCGTEQQPVFCMFVDCGVC